MQYNKIPRSLGQFEVKCQEMMFYQYLPIKLSGQTTPIFEDRLQCFSELMGVSCCDFIGVFGLNRYVESYVYITAKHMYQQPGAPFNRPGYHSDGFMTEDINYVWCDKYPTIFNNSCFEISMDDSGSLVEMEMQADPANEYWFPENSLIQLDQYSIHKVAEIDRPGMRTFMKISFSRDKYDLIGNSINYLLDYKWEMKPRKAERNIPQSPLNNQ